MKKKYKKATANLATANETSVGAAVAHVFKNWVGFSH